MLTKETLAAQLNGREYGNETEGLDLRAIKAAGLLIVYGASDNLVEFEGLFRDEADVRTHEADISFDKDGVIQSWGEFAEDSPSLEDAKSLKAYWCLPNCPPWSFETSLPHAKFQIMEDGEVFCDGLVIDMN